ncbi:MAG: alpha/beta hydrolase [Eggerthellaceae bacterium]|nr:alpha/beta hydrolase [Eggerthellaceae bacterium]
MSETVMTRRDLFKLAGAATTVAVGASLVGCASEASAEPAKDTAKAAAGVTSVTLEQATSENVLTVEPSVTSVSLVEGITYKQVLSASGVTSLHLDLLVPSGDDDKPLVVFIPGGGFTGSNPQGSIVQRMALAQAGYVVASVQHRVVPGARFPQPLEDVKAAVRWLRANAATYHIDKERVAAMGNSSGGYFATMLGVTGDIAEFDTGDNLSESSAVSAVIDLYGVSDLTIIGAGLDPEIEQGHDSPATTEAMLINGTAFGGNKGASAFDTPETAAEASPFTYIDGTDPAFLIFHGDKDTLVSPVASAALAEELRAANVPVDRYTISGASHGGPLFDQPEVVDLMIEFLDKNVKNAGEEK